MNFSEYALSCVGKTRAELGLAKSLEWCAEFVSHVITTCRPDLESVTSISCNRMKELMLESGLFYEPNDAPKTDDIGFIDWNRGADGDIDRPLDHVVVIAKGYGDLYVDYIDGNSTDGGGNGADGKVCKHFKYHMNVTDKYPDYYLRLKPNVISETKTSDKKSDSDLIIKLQSIRDSLSDIINELIYKGGD